MRPAEDVKKLIQNLNDTTTAEMDDRVLGDVMQALAESNETQSAGGQPNIWRTIMKSHIPKLTAAAAVTALVVLGLFEFLSGDNSSGVVWAEVAQKVQASRGVIYRNRSTHSGLQADSDYSIVYLSETKSRDDSYKAEQIIRTSHHDFNTKTFTWIAHDAKKYTQDTMSEETLREQHGAWASPKRWITEFLSKDHRKLGQKTIDGVLCEGLETTDTTFGVASFQVESLVAHIWVSVKTRYPVLLEAEVVGDNGQLRIAGILDQFQWDVELDLSLFEPDIPPDYTLMKRQATD